MAITINHQTNDISATSGSMTIDGASAGGAMSLISTTTLSGTATAAEISLPQGYKYFEFFIPRLSAASESSFNMQIKNGATTQAAKYVANRNVKVSISSFQTPVGSTSSTFIQTTNFSIGNATGEAGIGGVIKVWDARSATNVTRILFDLIGEINDARLMRAHGGAVQVTAADTDTIRLYISGNLTGEIQLWGVV